MTSRAQQIQDEISRLEDEWEEEVTTFIRLNKKAQKVVKRKDLPRGKRVVRNGQQIPVNPIPIIAIMEAK